MSPTVIVFGPTGQSGSVAALTARSHGAKVVLGMRDTSKPIPGLSKEQEEKDGYQRVQANLTDPASLSAAVKTSGATRAFIYIAHPPTDHMRGALEALKSAGVTFVVLLSSFSIAPFGDDLRSIPPSEIIPWIHAQVEISLDEVYGPDHYVALRPGFFASNLFRNKDGIAKGEVRLYGGDLKADCIVPADIGAVGGTILASQDGPKDGQNKVYLSGPQDGNLRDAILKTGKAVGKDVKIIDVDKAEGGEQFLALRMPKPLVDYMVRKIEGKPDPRPHHEEGVENIQRYTGKPATTLEAWARSNKQVFTT